MSSNPLTILVGDVREKLRELPDESVNCVVTSPPYWSLRSYLPEGHPDKNKELGSEKTLDEYIKTMTGVFEEVRRILRSDGTLWLNMGDSYNAYNHNRGPAAGANKNHHEIMPDADKGLTCPELKPKDLCGVPWRLAFALQAAGWWLRCDIIWHKPNPMPESCQDRPTHAHEYIFLMTKSATYWYDAEAIKEPLQESSLDRGYSYSDPDYTSEKMEASEPGMIRANKTFKGKRYIPSGRNKRSVWTVPSQAYPGAHFATFPEKLITPCILAGCPAQTCPKCGAPWEREVEKSRTFESGSGRAGNLPAGKNGEHLQGGGETLDIRRGPCLHTQTLGFRPTCKCGCKDTIPGTVLDPFAGSGTTGKVAFEYGRRAILIELNPAYVTQVKQRTETTMGLAIA